LVKNFPELTFYVSPGIDLVKLGKIEKPLRPKKTNVEPDSLDTEKIDQNVLFRAINKRNQLNTYLLVKTMDGDRDFDEQMVFLEDLIKYFSKTNAPADQYGLLTNLKTVTFVKYSKTEDIFSAQRRPLTVPLEIFFEGQFETVRLGEGSKTIYLLIASMLLRQIKELSLID
jgi:hypothetical protein